VSRPTRGPLSRCPVRGCHPLRPAFPDASGTKDNGHWPVPRSLATTDGISRRRLSPPPSRAACATRMLMSVPPATEMFQFAGFASCTYEFSTGYAYGWVSPFAEFCSGPEGPHAVIPLGAALPHTLISDLPGGFGNRRGTPTTKTCRRGPRSSRLSASGRCAAPPGS